MIERMDHAGIAVDDLAAATEFFVALGLEPRGGGPVEGRRGRRATAQGPRRALRT
jgi:catechol 2,3-dioxygenase-like lactoylglutathione lyase family enzyme